MVNRINLILKAKNITARQFAEEIGVQPSGMSHILSGRNNPSLDFVMKVIRRYPEIDINWLMFGKGEMYEMGKREREVSPTPSRVDEVSRVYDVQENNVSIEKKKINEEASVVKKEETVPELFDVEPDLFSSVPQQQSEKTIVEAPIQSQTVNPIVGKESIAPKPASIVPQTSVSPQSEMRPRQAAAPILSAAASATPQRLEGETPLPPVPAGKKVVRLLVFYDDHTFGEYIPE